MRLSCIVVAFALAAGVVESSGADADPRSDAQQVVQILVNQTTINAMLDSVEPLTRQALQSVLFQGENAKLSASSRDVVITLFLSEFRSRFQTAMRDELVQVYMLELSPADLAGLRAFLETPAGRALGDKQASIIRRSSQVGARIGSGIGPVAAKAVADRLAADGNNLIANPTDLDILRRTFPKRWDFALRPLLE
jgi:hypothetical protein